MINDFSYSMFAVFSMFFVHFHQGTSLSGEHLAHSSVRSGDLRKSRAVQPRGFGVTVAAAGGSLAGL